MSKKLMRVRFEYVEKLENVKSLCNKSVFHKKKDATVSESLQKLYVSSCCWAYYKFS